jgi:hypothetical protein
VNPLHDDKTTNLTFFSVAIIIFIVRYNGEVIMCVWGVCTCYETRRFALYQVPQPGDDGFVDV